MADAEGLEPLQLAVEAAVDLLEAEQGFRFYRGAMACLQQPGLGQLVELLVQGGHLLGAHGEAPGGGVAAEALQQGRALLQGPVHRKAPGRPHRGPQAAVALASEQGGGQAEALHQPGGHDADHAVVPVVLGQQQEGRALGTIGLEQGQGLGFDGGAEVAALAVERLAIAGQGQGPAWIFGGEQLHHQLGITKPADGVDPRRDLEAHRLGIEGRLVEAS